MIVLRPPQPLPEIIIRSIFLAGPSPRDETTVAIGHRGEALRHLEARGYDGVVFVPEPEHGFAHSYIDQIDWERTMRLAADVETFWVPRDQALQKLPGFTTNVEFGEDWPTRKVLYGRPDEAPKNRYLDARWRATNGEDPHNSMAAMLDRALAYLGSGARREGVHASVPLGVWRQASFQRWLTNLHAAGNRLRSFELQRAWPAASGDRAPLETPWAAFVARAGVWDAREQRVKDNEVFLARGDAVAVAAFACPRAPSDCADHEVRVVLVQELRQAVNNPMGRVVELPGGSSFDLTLDDRGVAHEELFEEAGLNVAPERFAPVGARQMAATLLTHRTQLFAVRLTDAETRRVEHLVAERTLLGTAGKHVPEHARCDGERILLAFPTLAELRDWPLDWSARGMIAEAWEHLQVTG